MKKTIKKTIGGILCLVAFLLVGAENHTVVTAAVMLGSLWAGSKLVISTLK